ncbi:hypothetical protein N7509_005983 [Penicillium cosmopolitanum]|uniref:Lysine-specific metallo-endopeptidase domain-containing protein n=1 Tax=Penicillium cosmopolitanum TaxID=1131564 RepID=A0A9W9W3E3_9EURO|nr:uncharacterized protein N7509_005983 [Penicillium cosmopolitanum]KAJ5397870.1 hypothetical protein N7509_005983 [Penicillium cosmopolitanum]
MRLNFYSWLGLLGLSNLVAGKALDNVFNVKSGTTKGGCDSYRSGQVNENLDAYFEEAQKIIKTASDAFGKYNTDVQVQKLGKTFFGITPNSQQTGTNSNEDANLLKHVQDWFKDLDTYAQGGSGQKIPLYCNSDWLEETTTVYDSSGKAKNNQVVSDDKAYGKTVPQLKKKTWVAFWSDDLKEYYFGPPYTSNPPTYCGDNGNIAVVTPMSTGKESLSLTLCPGGFFKKPNTLEALDDSSSDIGHSLQSLETRSLSIVHELVHACKGPDDTPDINAWGPKAAIKPKIKGQPNPLWPGNTDDFINKRRVAYTASDAILTAQATNPRQPTENTPESYAWAALAVYLAENGAKMDYSTGLARPLGEPLTSPAPPRRFRKDAMVIAKDFVA